MKRATRNKIFFTVLSLIISAPIFAMAPRVEALEPKLLWEKELPFEVTDIKMAEQSGDVLIHSQPARQIILLNRNGNEVFHWGPRVDRQPMGADISADGSVITYVTSWTEKYQFEKRLAGWDETLHFATRNGKELWTWKGNYIRTELSPDGTLVAITGVSPGEGYGGIIMLNAEGKELWRYKGKQAADISFSPDSKYIVGADGDLYLLTREGELVWKKERMFAIGAERYFVTNEGQYVYSPIDEKVFDKQGNLVHEGDNLVSKDGRLLNISYQNKTVILSLPEKNIVREFPFASAGFISDDGNLMGKDMGDKLGIIDTGKDISVEIPINTEFRVRGSTGDGKYLIVVIGDKRILYYQLFK